MPFGRRNSRARRRRCGTGQFQFRCGRPDAISATSRIHTAGENQLTVFLCALCVSPWRTRILSVLPLSLRGESGFSLCSLCLCGEPRFSLVLRASPWRTQNLSALPVSLWRTQILSVLPASPWRTQILSALPVSPWRSFSVPSVATSSSPRRNPTRPSASRGSTGSPCARTQRRGGRTRRPRRAAVRVRTDARKFAMCR